MEKLTINATLLSKDCKEVAKHKNMTFSNMIEVGGLNSGYIANCRAKYQIQSAKLGIPLQKDCVWGLCTKEGLVKICEIFELGDWMKYLHESEIEKITKAEEPEQTPVEVSAQIKADIQNIGLLLLDIRNLLHEIHAELV